MKHLLETLFVNGDQRIAIDINFEPKAKSTRFEVAYGLKAMQFWTLTEALQYRDIVAREFAKRG